MSNRDKAKKPEDLTRQFTDLANAGDVDGLTMLYEDDAVLAYPPGHITRGREAIRSVYERMMTLNLKFEHEEALPTIEVGDLALTSTYRRDGAGTRVQVARRQPDGSWLRVLDRPETPAAEGQ